VHAGEPRKGRTSMPPVLTGLAFGWDTMKRPGDFSNERLLSD
jgi:hypothetical protein